MHGSKIKTILPLIKILRKHSAGRFREKLRSVYQWSLTVHYEWLRYTTDLRKAESIFVLQEGGLVKDRHRLTAWRYVRYGKEMAHNFFGRT